jgi:hypothetical protein
MRSPGCLFKTPMDAAALRRFVAQFPDSARRKDAEGHLASLLAAQTAWNSVRDSKDPDQLRQFIRQFPDSLQRDDVEARLSSLLAQQRSRSVTTICPAVSGQLGTSDCGTEDCFPCSDAAKPNGGVTARFTRTDTLIAGRAPTSRLFQWRRQRRVR